MSKTEYDVCLVVVSRSTPLVDLSARIGIQGSEGSHSEGDPHLLKDRGVWKSTVWQICSGQPRSAHLEDHFEHLAGRLPVSRVVGSGALPDDAEVYVSVGVFSDAQIPTVNLTRRCLAIAEAFGARIEVRQYAPDMG